MRQLEAGHWQRSAAQPEAEALGRVVSGRTLGVWSLGKIGSRVAAIGRALGMRVVIHGREQSRQAAEASGYDFAADRRAFLAQCDIVSLHLLLEPRTRAALKERVSFFGFRASKQYRNFPKPEAGRGRWRAGNERTP